MAQILVFGDSITWGAYDLKHGGWVERLKTYFMEKDSNVYNLGISGDTTQGVVERFDVECGAREPDVLIFAIGINDSHTPEISFRQFESNIKILMEKAKKASKRIAFIGLTPVDEKLVKEDNYFNEKIRKYDSKIKELCGKEKILFLEIFDKLTNADLDDGLHPNSKGHEKIFNAVKDFLIKSRIIS